MSQEMFTYTVKKRKATRVAYRMVGVFFVLLGAFFVWSIYLFGSVGLKRVFMTAFGVALFLYGANLVKASFRKAAFDLVYYFEEESLRVAQSNKEWTFAYDKIINVNLVVPDPAMPYYLLKIDVAKDQFVLPFMGRRDKCDAIYHFLLRKMGMYDGMDESKEESDS